MKISPISFYSFQAKSKPNYSKENNVAILGSSKATDSVDILNAMVKASEVSRLLVHSGKNILTGCGAKGVMGSAFYSAVNHSTRDENGKPEQNIVILKRPFWGDEDFDNCTIFGSEKSEAARIERFIETADSFVIFPGGPGTLQEATTIISNNYYNKENPKKVVLVGLKYFENLDEQYWKMYDAGLIDCIPYELYTIVDEVDEVLKEIEK